LTNDPKVLRPAGAFLFCVFALGTAIFAFQERSGPAVFALGCAVALSTALTVAHRLEMLEVQRRLDALEGIKKGYEGTEGK
jgi:hypothetical protein